jgi:hypothetical protein
MRTTRRLARPAGVALLLAAAVAPLMLIGRAADHRDGPIFPNTAVNGPQDLNDIYVFRSPTNANNTVLIFTFQPFPGNLSPATADQSQFFDVKIDRTGDAVEDVTFRVTLGAPDENGVQPVTLRGLPSTLFPPTGILARGMTGQNLPIAGGGMFRCAIQDDPFFFDAGSAATGGFADLAQDGVGAFPRPLAANPANPQPNEARNFFGPNGNTFAVVIEMPSSRIAPNNSLIGVFVRTEKNGVQVDNMGRPAINTALIPPLPRNVMPANERRNAFNASLPRNHRRDFRADMVGVLQSFYGRTAADAGAIADLLLPDMVIFQVGNPNGFGTFLTSGTGQGGFFAGTVLGNGRRLRDDVIDFELSVLTNGGITTDNVPDDNGTRITDGNMGTVAAFPYVGPANLPLNGPGTGPNP